jgi:hypothetical protein
MPAGAEAVRAERAARRAENAKQPPEASTSDTGAGERIIQVAWAATAVWVAATAVAAVVSDARLVVALIDLVLFFGGCGAFFWALAVAADRSRQREIGLWNLFLLEGVAPSRVRKRLLGALALEVVVAVGAAFIAPPLAFGLLVPMWALGCCGLWGAKHGQFAPRRAAPPRGGRRGTSVPDPGQ